MCSSDLHWGFHCSAALRKRELAAWQAEQAHISGKEKQEVPAGELPVVHIAVVCGFWQGASFGAHPVFVLPLIF